MIQCYRQKFRVFFREALKEDCSMKLLISTTVVLVFSLYMAPAMAFDNGGSVQGPTTFAAFRHMSTLERATLTPLADTELASIEGASLAIVQQTSASNGPNFALIQQASSPNGPNFALIQQASS